VVADPDLNTNLHGHRGRPELDQLLNPQFDQCLVDGRSEYDTAKRQEIYKKCQRIVHEDAFLIRVCPAS